MNRSAVFMATVAYLGYARLAPGTVGSAAGLVVVAASRFAGVPPRVELAGILALALVGVWASGLAEEHFQRHDPGPIVIDEVVGMLITLAMVPLTPATGVVGFLLFRVSDIVKPYPARRLEAWPRGWGIMADDVVAAVYAHLALRVFMWAGGPWLA